MHFLIFYAAFIHGIAAFLDLHEDFVAKQVPGFTIPDSACDCGREEHLNGMALVEFENGHKYLVSEQSFGRGRQAKIYHAIYVGKQWVWNGASQHLCVALKKAADMDIVEAESEKLETIWRGPKKPTHIIQYYTTEFFYNENNYRRGAIAMELGKANLNTYWSQQMQWYRNHGGWNNEMFEKFLLHLMEQMAEALREVHDRGFIFIDLNGSNLLVTRDAPEFLNLQNLHKLDIKLTDFGAAVPRGFTEITNKKFNTYTHFYAPDEVKLADKPSKKVSPKTDVFAIGRVTLELLMRTPHFVEYVRKNELRETFSVTEVNPSEDIKQGEIFDILIEMLLITQWGQSEEAEGMNDGKLFLLNREIKKEFPRVMDLVEKIEKDRDLRPTTDELIRTAHWYLHGGLSREVSSSSLSASQRFSQSMSRRFSFSAKNDRLNEALAHHRRANSLTFEEGSSSTINEEEMPKNQRAGSLAAIERIDEGSSGHGTRKKKNKIFSFLKKLRF